MNLRLNESENYDRFGQAFFTISGMGEAYRQLHQIMFKHYAGYKFVIPIDVYADELDLSSIPKDMPIYFLDGMEDELLEYLDDRTIIKYLEGKGYTVRKGRAAK